MEFIINIFLNSMHFSYIIQVYINVLIPVASVFHTVAVILLLSLLLNIIIFITVIIVIISLLINCIKREHELQFIVFEATFETICEVIKCRFDLIQLKMR